MLHTDRDPTLPLAQCHDCGALEGQLHNYFPRCDMETCPICLGQLLGCPHSETPEKVVKQGRIPFIHFPILCAKCGAVDPDFFTVPDREWRAVVPKGSWDIIVCRRCYDHLAKLQPPRPLPRKKRGVVDTDTASLF